MAFKLKKTSDNLFHKVSVSQSKQAPTNPMLNVGTSGKNNPSATPLKDIDSKGRDRPLTAAQQAADDKEASITPPFDKKKKDPYAEAAKKDSKLGSYVKARKSLKKGTAEWNANQNKINKAYGVKKRYDETPKPKPTPKPTGTDAMQAIAPDTKKKKVVVKKETKVVVKKETSKKASKLREKGNEVLSDKSLSTEEKQKKALSIRRKYDKQNSKVEKKAKVKTAKVGKIEARANVAEAKGNNRRAERLRAKAERKETGVSRKDQGRNIFGGKTRKQKKKEAQAKTKAGSAPDFSGMS
jgi:hypothetical protein